MSAQVSDRKLMYGAIPYGGVTFDSAGNLYGTTALGGGGTSSGVAFRISP
ncbi:MAG TPA: hypothetical protein VGP65_07800 [Candidatus Angelobacter sp.]|nr:hypothetical protein [Candidatus Angelobacter sp.]